MSKADMKILITGASGLLGRALKKEFEQNTRWEIIGLGYNRVQEGLLKVDLRNESEVSELIGKFQPHVVIHSAAERRPDVMEKQEEAAQQLNVAATEYLAANVNKYGGFMLYISTDYVFDGENPPYKSSDKPNPLNRYGKSKLQGEIRTKDLCKNFGVLRIPILYGDVENLNESAVTGLFQVLKNVSQPATVSDFEQRYPTCTSDIAVVCRQIVEYRQNHPSFCGVWQWRSNDKLTKYQMVGIMANIFHLSMDHITASKQPPNSGTRRPYDCELDCSELEAIRISSRTSFQDVIEKYLNPHL